jgi:hypothetical protein
MLPRNSSHGAAGRIANQFPYEQASTLELEFAHVIDPVAQEPAGDSKPTNSRVSLRLLPTSAKRWRMWGTKKHVSRALYVGLITAIETLYFSIASKVPNIRATENPAA